jgi:hypothetical protein
VVDTLISPVQQCVYPQRTTLNATHLSHMEFTRVFTLDCGMFVHSRYFKVLSEVDGHYSELVHGPGQTDESVPNLLWARYRGNTMPSTTPENSEL